MFLNVLLLVSLFFSSGTEREKSPNLKVISFNIKVDSKADSANCWNFRQPLMMKFLEKERPDILCLQEVLISQLNDFKAHLPKYNMVGVSRIDGKEKGDFIPIFYRKDIFDQINSGTFCISEKPDSIGFIGWDAKYPRIATSINLRNVHTGEILFVMNVHLDNVGKVARIQGMRLILEKIRLLAKSENIILTGDFNVNSSSKVHEVVSQGNLFDTYQMTSNIKGVPYTIHQFGKRDVSKRQRIDYVYISRDFKVIDVNIPKEKPKKGVFLSDHNPVIVRMAR